MTSCKQIHVGCFLFKSQTSSFLAQSFTISLYYAAYQIVISWHSMVWSSPLPLLRGSHFMRFPVFLHLFLLPFFFNIFFFLPLFLFSSFGEHFVTFLFNFLLVYVPSSETPKIKLRVSLFFFEAHDLHCKKLHQQWSTPTKMQILRLTPKTSNIVKSI